MRRAATREPVVSRPALLRLIDLHYRDGVSEKSLDRCVPQQPDIGHCWGGVVWLLFLGLPRPMLISLRQFPCWREFSRQRASPFPPCSFLAACLASHLPPRLLNFAGAGGPPPCSSWTMRPVLSISPSLSLSLPLMAACMYTVPGLHNTAGTQSAFCARGGPPSPPVLVPIVDQSGRRGADRGRDHSGLDIY